MGRISMAVIYVTRDDEYAGEIRQKLIDNYTAEANESNRRREAENLIHVSDIVFPRKTYYQVIQGRKVTDKAIGFWFTGKAYGTELQRVLGNQFAEIEVKVKDFVAHMDYFDGFLIGEIKTSRKWTIPAHPSPHYIRQTAYYCAMSDKTRAQIVVIYPTAGRTWKGEGSSTIEIRSWALEVPNDSKIEVLRDMVLAKSAIIDALDRRDPSRLPPVPGWLVEEFPGADPGEYDEKTEQRFPFAFIDVEAHY
jgi:hypothetical protein